MAALTGNSAQGHSPTAGSAHRRQQHFYKLRQGGYVFIGVNSFISWNTQQLLNRFSQNSVERWWWHMGHGRIN